MKNMLKEAWAEREKEEEGNGQKEMSSANHKKGEPNQLHDDGGKKKSNTTKKKPEVIFDVSFSSLNLYHHIFVQNIM